MHQVLNKTAKGATGTALRVVYPELVVIPSTRRPMSFLVRCSKLYAFQEFLELRSQGRRHPGCCVVLRQSWTGHNQILVVSDNRAAGQSLIAWLRSLILGLSGYVSSGTINQTEFRDMFRLRSTPSVAILSTRVPTLWSASLRGMHVSSRAHIPAVLTKIQIIC